MNKRVGTQIAHLNIRGIINKIDQLKFYIASFGIKILHISETFLSSWLRDFVNTQF